MIPKSYTFSRRPVKLIWMDEFSTKDEAFVFERQVKGWNRKKKEALIRGDWEAIHQIVKEERTTKESEKRKK
jgi:predicted GIY-YIG superfamily endonuclease